MFQLVAALWEYHEDEILDSQYSFLLVRDHENQREVCRHRGIIRNQRKIDAAINNARVMTKMHREGHQLCTVLTTLIPQPIINHPQQFTDIPTQNRLSRNLAKEFKEIGFQFMGPVTTYSFLEAVGLINDHIEDCPFKYTTT